MSTFINGKKLGSAFISGKSMKSMFVNGKKIFGKGATPSPGLPSDIDQTEDYYLKSVLTNIDDSTDVVNIYTVDQNLYDNYESDTLSENKNISGQTMDGEYHSYTYVPTSENPDYDKQVYYLDGDTSKKYYSEIFTGIKVGTSFKIGQGSDIHIRDSITTILSNSISDKHRDTDDLSQRYYLKKIYGMQGVTTIQDNCFTDTNHIALERCPANVIGDGSFRQAFLREFTSGQTLQISASFGTNCLVSSNVNVKTSFSGCYFGENFAQDSSWGNECELLSITNCTAHKSMVFRGAGVHKGLYIDGLEQVGTSVGIADTSKGPFYQSVLGYNTTFPGLQKYNVTIKNLSAFTDMFNFCSIYNPVTLSGTLLQKNYEGTGFMPNGYFGMSTIRDSVAMTNGVLKASIFRSAEQYKDITVYNSMILDMNFEDNSGVGSLFGADFTQYDNSKIIFDSDTAQEQTSKAIIFTNQIDLNVVINNGWVFKENFCNLTIFNSNVRTLTLECNASNVSSWDSSYNFKPFSSATTGAYAWNINVSGTAANEFASKYPSKVIPGNRESYTQRTTTVV